MESSSHPGPASPGGTSRIPPVNGVGKPCAGEPHARIDGRELETERCTGHGRGEEQPRRETAGHPRLHDLPPIYATAPAPDPPPGFAVHGRAREASLQVSAVSRPSAERLLAGACSDGPRSKSLTTRCRLGQRRRSRPSTGTDSW